MVALVKEDPCWFLEVDRNQFSTALSISEEDEEDSAHSARMELIDGMQSESFFVISGPNAATTLQLNHAHKSGFHLSANGVISLMNRYNGIRELSLSYSLLSDELLKALSSEKNLQLKTLRVEAHPDTKPITNVSCETWIEFADHFPNLILLLQAYLIEASDYEGLLAKHIPVTHLYLGDCVPNGAIDRIPECCPKLTELVIASYGPQNIDHILLATARSCPRLIALGLGDCEFTCSGFIEFVRMCCQRLQVLYVLETSLLEDSTYNNVAVVSAKVSALLGRSWHPNYVPY
ncbi:hypothetical protein QAD02_019791 [Eretmocerus hayati]|uniref:Uncharacterized protein n=1 Tax=Eretmocerus hayati TaxID=131215 RepID=A0ACC2PL34_9HYME|nr:hypothetical protein QAD02_019791 [Eretmocerus hayati]